MKKTLLSLAAALLCLGATAQSTEPVETTFDCVADTWIRTDNGGSKNGTGDKVELRTLATDNQEVFNKFIALIGFDYELPEGQKVQKATLKLVTERIKSGPISLHAYKHNFTEGDACWNVEKDYVEPLLSADPLLTFNAAGQYPKAIFDGGLNADKQNLAAWTNEIDVTEYVKTLTVNDTRANFMLHLPFDKVYDQVCFYTKDNKGFNNTNYNFSATADELKPTLTVTFVEDANTINDAILPIADTCIRSDKAGDKKGKENSMEIYWNADGTDPAKRVKEFYGLMSFKMPAEVVNGTHEIKSAKLRLVCTQNKSDRGMNIYAYPAVVDEDNANWNSEKDNVAAALATEPIATYSVNGAGGCAMWDNGKFSDDYKNVEKWANEIDLTDYLKANPKDLNIMLGRVKATNGNAMKIATKEATDNVSGDYTFTAADQLPKLFITYSKKEGGNTGVDDVTVNDENAPVEYYNLQGVRVENPAPGQLYIKRQGSKATKVLFR